jgi:hypothetical protein
MEDPYTREEFIMSISLKNAEFGIIQDDKRVQELEVYNKTI